MTETLTITGINQMERSAYHADKGAWSRGMIADFRDRRSICYAKHVACTAPPDKVSKAMELGDLAHAALLEPWLLDAEEGRYMAMPDELLSDDGGIRTKAAREWKYERESRGCIVLKRQDFETVAAMVASVTAKVGKWIIAAHAKVEHAVYWIDRPTGLTCRCRPDVLIERDVVYCLDIKTTPDVSPPMFRKRIEDGGLLLQDAHYSEGLRVVTGKSVKFLFVAVESTWPFTCAVYEINPDQRDTGWAQRHETMNQIADCINTGVWVDSWENDINVVTLRPFAMEQRN